MLVPLYDQKSELIAWLDPDKHIFDTSMRWIAYIKNGHAWSSETGNWLGAVNGTECQDRSGRVFAWGKDTKPRGGSRPFAPARQMKPPRPSAPPRPFVPARQPIPPRPMYGWSGLSLNAWLRQ